MTAHKELVQITLFIIVFRKVLPRIEADIKKEKVCVCERERRERESASLVRKKERCFMSVCVVRAKEIVCFCVRVKMKLREKQQKLDGCPYKSPNFPSFTIHLIHL